MACKCANIDSGTLVATLLFDDAISQGCPLTMVDWKILTKNGVPLVDTQPSWFTWSVGPGDAVEVTTDVFEYHLPITAYVDMTGAYPTVEDNLSIYRGYYHVQRTDCKAEPVECKFTFRLPNICKGRPLDLQTFLYAISYPAGATPLRLMRLWVDSPWPSTERWRLCDVIDPGQAHIRIDPAQDFVFTCDAIDKIERTDLRGNTRTTVWSSGSIDGNRSLAIDPVNQKILVAISTPEESAPTIKDAAYDGTGKATVYAWAGAGNIAAMRVLKSARRIIWEGQTGADVAIWVVDLDGTDFAKFAEVDAGAGSDLSADENEGAGGVIFYYGNVPGLGLAFHRFDVATSTWVTLPYAPAAGVHALDYRAKKVYVPLATGGEAFRRFRVLNYDGDTEYTQLARLLPFGTVTAAEMAYVLADSPGFLSYYEQQEAFSYLIDAAGELYEDTSLADPVEAGDDIASMREGGVRRNKFIQSTAPNRPQYALESGVPVINCNGSTDELVASGVAGTVDVDMLDGERWTAYAVIKQTGTNARNTLFSIKSGSTNIFRVYATYDDTIKGCYGNPGAAPSHQFSVAQPAGWDDTWHRLVIRRGYDAGGADPVSIRVDGVEILSSTTAGSFNTLAGTYTFSLFSDNGADWFAGSVALVAIYAAYHDDTKVAEVEAQLALDYAAILP